MIHGRILLVAGVTMALAACRAEPEEPVDGPLNTVGNLVEALPAPEPLVSRADLLAAVSVAASSYATGQPVPADILALSGRQFSMRIAFGCDAEAGGAMALTPRKDGKAYEVRIRPSIELKQLEGLVGEDVESAEGFWLPRPWLLDGRCPKTPEPVTEETADPATDVKTNAKPKVEDKAGDMSAPPAPDHSVGIVQLFTANDSRVGQRSGRDYVKIEKLEKDQLPPPGLALVLEGRLQNWPGGSPIQCSGDANLTRPSCLILSRVDRVEIRRQDNNAVVAEWHR